MSSCKIFLAAGLEAKPTIHQSLANAIDEMGYTQRDGAKTVQETGGGGKRFILIQISIII